MENNNLFQKARENCAGCYYGFHDEHNEDICYTTPNKYSYMENAMNALESIKNFGGNNDKEIAQIALQACLSCLENGKPKAKSIINILNKNGI